MGTRAFLGLAVAAGLLVGVALSYAPSAVASRNSSGSYSLPAGPAVPGTVISSSWMNTTLGDIGAEVTNSLDRQGRGAMLAPLQLSNGTSGAPALTFASEPASGLYRPGAGEVRIVVQTVTTMRHTASGVTLPVAVTAQAGVTATTTATSGTAITATGGGPSGTGLVAIGGGTGRGADIYGGLQATAGTAATAGVRQNAVALYGGDLNLFNVVNPDRTTAVSKTLTPKNLVSAWARVDLNAGAITVHDGFNVASVSLVTTGLQPYLRLTFASAFAGATFVCSALTGGAEYMTVQAQTTTTADFWKFHWSTGAVDMGAGAHSVHVVCTGAQ
jgi:hypothetical protein